MGLAMFAEAKIHYVPSALINFVVRTVLGAMWADLLSVAEDVRDGKRPQHAAAIEEKRELLYDWVDFRVQQMLSAMESS